jgi:hypothetical protein
MIARHPIQTWSEDVHVPGDQDPVADLDRTARVDFRSVPYVRVASDTNGRGRLGCSANGDLDVGPEVGAFCDSEFTVGAVKMKVPVEPERLPARHGEE